MLVITGSKGKLGSKVLKVFPGALGVSRDILDVSDREKTFDFIKKNKPETIIHLAAMTNVRQCQIEKARAYEINVLGTENLIDACLNFNPDSYFIYMSTACVFYGDRGDYTENDLPYPKNFYSLTKLLGEFVVRKIKQYLIIRGNFVAKETWPYEKAFTDRFGTYLFADDLAQAIKDVIGQKMTGLVHLVGEEKLSMFDLAKITTPEVKPMTMAGMDLPLTVDMSLRSIRTQPYKISK